MATPDKDSSLRQASNEELKRELARRLQEVIEPADFASLHASCSPKRIVMFRHQYLAHDADEYLIFEDYYLRCDRHDVESLTSTVGVGVRSLSPREVIYRKK